MTTSIERRNSSGLAKSNAAVRILNRRLDKAWQVRNERVARADADYKEAVRRAVVDDVEPATTAPAIEPSTGTQPEAAATA